MGRIADITWDDIEILDDDVFEKRNLAKTFSEVLKYNDCHDKLGRFASKNGGGVNANTTASKIEIGYGAEKKEYETDTITAEFSKNQKENSGMLAMADKKDEILGPVKEFYSQYQKGTANKDNYHVNTIAEFKEAKRPRRKPDYTSYTRDGKVSSEYWYSEQGVIRGSKHWGSGVASCDWFMQGQSTNMSGNKQYGECKWSEFTQKPKIVTSGNKAIMSTFDNTIGGIKQKLGLSTPIVRGFNEGADMKKADTETHFPPIYIEKADEDKRLVFGWALVSATSDGQQIIDHQGDIVDQDELEEGAYEYVLNFRDAGEEHIGTLRKKARMVESVVFTEEKLKAMGIPAGNIPYGWWIGFYVDDDETWAKIKDGTYQMFSIEGKAVREPVDEPLAKSFSELIGKKNPYHDRLGRFTTASGAASYSYDSKTTYTDSKAKRNYTSAVADSTLANDGSTTKVGRTKGPKTGYMVAVDNERGKIYEVSKDRATAKKQLKKAVEDFMEKNKDILSQKDKYLGTWIDKSDGKVYLDVSTHVKSKADAIKLGKKYNQIAIWDNKNGAEISTGGTGEVPTSKSYARTFSDILGI